LVSYEICTEKGKYALPWEIPIAPPGGEAQAVEVLGGELKVPKVNSFAKGESTTY
jgi:hypothetical protein